MHILLLPDELLKNILYMAYISVDAYIPEQPEHSDALNLPIGIPLNLVKRVLASVSVCRRWKNLAASFLFRALEINYLNVYLKEGQSVAHLLGQEVSSIFLATRCLTLNTEPLKHRVKVMADLINGLHSLQAIQLTFASKRLKNHFVCDLAPTHVQHVSVREISTFEASLVISWATLRTFRISHLFTSNQDAQPVASDHSLQKLYVEHSTGVALARLLRCVSNLAELHLLELCFRFDDIVKDIPPSLSTLCLSAIYLEVLFDDLVNNLSSPKMRHLKRFAITHIEVALSSSRYSRWSAPLSRPFEPFNIDESLFRILEGLEDPEALPGLRVLDFVSTNDPALITWSLDRRLFLKRIAEERGLIDSTGASWVSMVDMSPIY